MNRLLLTMTALAGLAVAAPAAAQYSAEIGTQAWSGVDIRNRIAALDNRLQAGVRAGVISGAEEESLLDELSDLRHMEQRYSYNGLTFAERRDLQDRILAAQRQIQLADNGRFDSDTRYGYYGRGNARLLTSADFRDRIERLQMRLDAGVRSGDLTVSEASALRVQVANLRALERRYSFNGFTIAERENLINQLRVVRQNISYADSGRFDNDTRFSWYDPGYTIGVRGPYTGMGGPIEAIDECRDRGSGLSGLFNNVFGRSCLRIGDLATRNMYTVPPQWRYQYRDTADVYYRYDGDFIYAIDADTNRVISSWDVN